jgi:hypothetical protein
MDQTLVVRALIEGELPMAVRPGATAGRGGAAVSVGSLPFAVRTGGSMGYTQLPHAGGRCSANEPTAWARRVMEKATARAQAISSNAENRLAELTGRHDEVNRIAAAALASPTSARQVTTTRAGQIAGTGGSQAAITSGSQKPASSPAAPQTASAGTSAGDGGAGPEVQQAASSPPVPGGGPPNEGPARD